MKILLALFSLLFVVNAFAAEWHVTTNGTPKGQGTKRSPWDLESTLRGQRSVMAGDTIWIASGTYKHRDRKSGAMGFEVRLAGSEKKPIHVRALPAQRVTIDGGLNVQPPSTHLWLRDLEIIVSENVGASRRIEESGSHPQSYDRPWGGLNIYSGVGCKFINLIIHDNAQGVSWWTPSRDSELHGCIIYGNGWDAPDRGHGHAIYTQNDDGVKTISDCIMTGGYGYTLHAYGSNRADVNNYLVSGNIFYNAGPFLIGSGKPSRNIRVLMNFLYGVPLQLGYDAPYNEDCEVSHNVLVNGTLAINKYRQVTKEDNVVLTKDDPRPSGVRTVLRSNRFGSNRANVVILNWEKRSTIEIDPKDFLKKGQSFHIVNPTNFFGQPIVSGTFDGRPIAVPAGDEFVALVLVKQ
jgi:hypothetical protein